jgi:hypothetical protein
MPRVSYVQYYSTVKYAGLTCTTADSYLSLRNIASTVSYCMYNEATQMHNNQYLVLTVLFGPELTLLLTPLK